MVEPPAAPSGIAAWERDVLLATKLHVPAVRPDLVPRPRLAERLDESLARGLVLICAPAGYGKTVLLADWVRRSEHPAAWLSLDAGDNDPARFWRHAVAALDRARPGVSDRVAGLLGTTCSPICFAPACSKNSPPEWRSCTVTRPPGTSGTSWPTTRYGTRRPRPT